MVPLLWARALRSQPQTPIPLSDTAPHTPVTSSYQPSQMHPVSLHANPVHPLYPAPLNSIDYPLPTSTLTHNSSLKVLGWPSSPNSCGLSYCITKYNPCNVKSAQSNTCNKIKIIDTFTQYKNSATDAGLWLLNMMKTLQEVHKNIKFIRTCRDLTYHSPLFVGQEHSNDRFLGRLRVIP